VTKAGFETTTLRNTHNLAVHGDHLYRCNADASRGVYIYSLTGDVSTSTWLLAGQIDRECHDVHVVTIGSQEIAFVSAGYTGRIYVYDVTIKTAIVPLSDTTYPNAMYAHQLTTDATNTYLYLNDELYRQQDLNLQ
jgi:hypothetical protein